MVHAFCSRKTPHGSHSQASRQRLIRQIVRQPGEQGAPVSLSELSQRRVRRTLERHHACSTTTGGKRMYDHITQADLSELLKLQGKIFLSLYMPMARSF